MKDIKCSCGNDMEYVDYIYTIGINGNFEIKCLYQCPTCKTIKLIYADYDELYENLYTDECKEMLIKESKSLNNYIINLMLLSAIIVVLFFIILKTIS